MNTRIIKAAMFTPGPKGRWGLPLILIGKPGSAKTSNIEAGSFEWGLALATLISSLREPSDFLGLPIPVKKKEGAKQVTRVEYAPPGWALSLAGQQRGIAFFDEINTSPPAVQAALLRVCLDGVVGEFELPKSIRFIGAMNATEEAAGGWDLAPPLANRFGHIPWDSPDAETWGDWLLAGAGDEDTKAGDAEQEEARVLAAWDKPWAQARGLVAGFIRRRPELLMKMPAVGDPKASKAWPSPRSWEMASRALAGAMVHGLNEADRDDFIGAFVGHEPLAEFAQWMAEADLPDPADLLDGKVKFKHDPSRLDRTAAILQACAAFVAPEKSKKRKDRASKLWEIMEGVKDARDVVVPGARALVRAKLANLDAARPVLLELQPVLAAANLRPS